MLKYTYISIHIYVYMYLDLYEGSDLTNWGMRGVWRLSSCAPRRNAASTMHVFCTRKGG